MRSSLAGSVFIFLISRYWRDISRPALQRRSARTTAAGDSMLTLELHMNFTNPTVLFLPGLDTL